MRKTPEHFYSQHKKDVERVEKAKATYEKHSEAARKAGDLTNHPELWDQASAEYQAEVKERIVEAAQADDYDRVVELSRGLQHHSATTEEYQKMKQKQYESKTTEKKLEAPIVKETRQEILEIMDEGTWKRAKDKASELLQSGRYPEYVLSMLADMRNLDPARFDKDIAVEGNSWQKLMENVEQQESDPTYYLLSARDLKNANPKLFEEQFWNRMDSPHVEDNWKRMKDQVWKSRDYPKKFIVLASAIKDLDPERFRQEILANEEFPSVWSRAVQEIKQPEKQCMECFVMYASAAQNIKPENEPDITINREEMDRIKSDLKNAKEYPALRTFFATANGVAKLKVV